MEKAKRILIVDDSEEIREAFDTALKLAGYETETAENGEAAFAKTLHNRPDLILLDVVMPQMDGLALLTKLRSDFAPPIPPAILISGFDLTEEEALRRGATRFLRKPLHIEDLLAAVSDLLDGKSPSREAVEKARQRTSTAREKVRTIATVLMRDLVAKTPPGLSLSQRASNLAAFVGRYLAVDAIVAAFLDEDRLRVLASSNPTMIAPSFDLGAALPIIDRVLESGSSLALPDLASHPCFSRFAGWIENVHYLMAVPIRFDNQAVGVLCVVDSHSNPIDGEELALVQLFSKRTTSLLSAWVQSRSDDELPLRVGPGIAPRTAFENALDLELRLLGAHGGSLELAIISDAELASVQTLVATSADPERLLAGALGDHRIALFKRDRAGDRRAKLEAIFAPLRKQAGVRIGVVDLSGGVFSALHASDLLRLAEQALDQTTESSDTLRRLVVEMRDA